MANPDVSALAAGLVTSGPEIFRSHVNSWDIKNQGILVLDDVSSPRALTKLSSTGSPRPYRTNDDSSGNTATFSDRKLIVNQTKWDFEPFTTENFRNTHLASQRDMLYETVTDKLSADYLAQVNDNCAYLGVYDANGNTAAAMGTGWGKIIADLITASKITPVVTGAITGANAVNKIEDVVDSAPAHMKSKKGFVYISFATWAKYRTHYRVLNGFGFAPKEGVYKLDAYPDITIVPASWMGNSGRVIYTLDQNLVFGTDGDAVTMHPSIKYDTIELRMKLPVGFEIQDEVVLIVNDQV